MRAAHNPFRFDRVTTLRFQSSDDWPTLWARLEAQNRRGAIVGPHGSGKTTLLGEVEREFERRGWRVTKLFFNDRARRLPPDFRPQTLGDGDALLLDGPEHLVFWHRLWLKRAVQKQALSACVLTAHFPLWLPTWIETSTSPQLLQTLCAELEVTLSLDEATKLWQEAGGDVREAFFRLYDQTSHEKVKKEP